MEQNAGHVTNYRNLRRILEILVRAETVPEESDGSGRADLVRSGLSDQIGQALSRETGTLVAYLLDPEIDDAVAGHPRGSAAGWSDETVTERLCDALHAELAHLPETASFPVVLTSSQLRSTVRARLRHEFPQIAVAGYNDIPDDLNVQPVARISWGS